MAFNGWRHIALSIKSEFGGAWITVTAGYVSGGHDFNNYRWYQATGTSYEDAVAKLELIDTAENWKEFTKQMKKYNAQRIKEDDSGK